MKIVKFIGGLGNQMFQYAFYKSCVEKCSEVSADLSPFNNYRYHQGYELDKLFGININIASLKDVSNLGFSSNKFGKVMQRIIKKKTMYIEKCIGYDENVPIFEKKDLYLEGYWHSYKYFSHIAEQIQDEFRFKCDMSEKTVEAVTQMKNINSVGIHVRRKDFLKSHNSHFVNLSATTYYEKAVMLVNKTMENPVYYVFSDDIEWVKDNLYLENAVYVDWNVGKNSFQDMYLMSCCKSMIIANSTFSWWGAWLNPLEYDKMIIAPSQWYKTKTVSGRIVKTTDLLLPDWILI